MNVQVFDRLIENLRNCDPNKFSMTAHTTCIMAYIDKREPLMFSRLASSRLEIPFDDSRLLFVDITDTSQGKVGLDDITRDEAVKALLHYKETGVVDWSIVRD